MLNFDPDSARQAPEVLKAVVRESDNKAGVYGTVLRRGRLAVGQPIFFERVGADVVPSPLVAYSAPSVDALCGRASEK